MRRKGEGRTERRGNGIGASEEGSSECVRARGRTIHPRPRNPHQQRLPPRPSCPSRLHPRVPTPPVPSPPPPAPAPPPPGVAPRAPCARPTPARPRTPPRTPAPDTAPAAAARGAGRGSSAAARRRARSTPPPPRAWCRRGRPAVLGAPPTTARASAADAA